MGTKHRGKRMFYYKYFTLNKMKEVHIMSKKILKRSLALGALMAFVITGSAWAIELPIGNETNKVTNAKLQSAGLIKLNNMRFVGARGEKVANVEM